MPIAKRSPPRKPPNKAKLGKAFIERLPVLDYDYLISDTEVSRLKLKVTPFGNRSFLIRYRNALGAERKLKLGDFPDMSATLARSMAARHLNNIAAGHDPAEERTVRKHGLTLSELFERFLNEYGQYHLRASTIVGYRQTHHSNIAQSLGKLPIAAITRNDVLDMHRQRATTPYVANRLIALIRRLYNWADTNGLYEGKNPTQGVKLYPEHAAERLLDKDETHRLAEALETIRAERPESEASVNVILFLFFTGCRRGEAFRIKWKEVDFERETVSFIAAKSGDRKQKMSSDLYEWLIDLKIRNGGEYLFPGRVVGEPLKDIKRTWDAVRRLANLPGLRLHDIRHNVLSDIAAEYDQATAQSIAGHKTGASTQRYIHARSTTTQAALEDSGRRVRDAFFSGRK